MSRAVPVACGRASNRPISARPEPAPTSSTRPRPEAMNRLDGTRCGPFRPPIIVWVRISPTIPQIPMTPQSPTTQCRHPSLTPSAAAASPTTIGMTWIQVIGHGYPKSYTNGEVMRERVADRDDAVILSDGIDHRRPRPHAPPRKEECCHQDRTARHDELLSGGV